MAGKVINDEEFDERSEPTEEEEDDESEEQFDVWEDWSLDEDEPESEFLCLFCDIKWSSIKSLFDHCVSNHSFDFQRIRKSLGLDFYDSFKLINYIRSQVAANKCWSCGLSLLPERDLENHLHDAINFEKDGKLPWQEDVYLQPFMQDDALLHSFGEDEDIDDDDSSLADKEELIRALGIQDLGEICIDDESTTDIVPKGLNAPNGNANKDFFASNGAQNGTNSMNGIKVKDKKMRVSFANVAVREIRNVNESYFGAYGSFGIHREMISDKVRTDAYRGAILNNPSLMKQANVLDVGCGTGILSLFAAQAGASRVVAVEASEKMATVATQVAKDNGLLWETNPNGDPKQHNGVINVVYGMVEELNKLIQAPPHSFDVLLSEWMGYCLLYESMLSSVLYARDHWLKLGGAILPDTATIFAAGFGKGGTSIPFWENVYGFDMSCIGKEVVEDAAELPIVDVMDHRDIITNNVVVKTFDLVTMKPDEMDFTSTFELELKFEHPTASAESKSKTAWCYGIVLWFETSFTSRFCKEVPTLLSTSPYGPKTHWSQTIFTFKEPIMMTSADPCADWATGADPPTNAGAGPSARIRCRMSIARAARHRSIDISLETTRIDLGGQVRRWPVQMFNL